MFKSDFLENLKQMKPFNNWKLHKLSYDIFSWKEPTD